MSTMRTLAAGFIAVIIATVVLGLAYPAAVWGVSRIVAGSADGHLVTDGGCVVVSDQLADGRAAAIEAGDVPDDADAWFHHRPDGMTNLSQSSPELAADVEQRRAAIAEREGVDPSAVPADALTGSGSGADPSISPAYAEIQIPRVARATGLPEEEVRALVADATHGRVLGILGEPHVNVTELNLSLPGGSACAK
ncbi:potassium-transporting ATPase subunit C [Corynebacterium sp.]|uniref:potassium-transporting ATPase subunit C n=1 Tax=Corynebacterium sp. TaxID=1720 RepID=UPI0026DCDE0B|nr:potassium-transporting ATPase subunit C [Corynebacterium sp.]MDO4609164.1 potassium-transporting ATPase subunit C [Corynebacterium sp.]